MRSDVSAAPAQCCKHLYALYRQQTYVNGYVGQGRAHAAEQRKDRESLEELIHSIQLESELTSRALKQSISVRPLCSTGRHHGR